MPIIRSSRLYLCYYRIWRVMPWLLVVGCQEQGSRLCVQDAPTTKASHTICGNNTSIVSSSWWWPYECPKHVEQIISAIKHSVASSWFSSLRLNVFQFANCRNIESFAVFSAASLKIPFFRCATLRQCVYSYTRNSVSLTMKALGCSATSESD